MFERAICDVSVTLTTSIAFERVTAKLMMLLGMCLVKYWQHKMELDPFNGKSSTANPINSNYFTANSKLV